MKGITKMIKNNKLVISLSLLLLVAIASTFIVHAALSSDVSGSVGEENLMLSNENQPDSVTLPENSSQTLKNDVVMVVQSTLAYKSIEDLMNESTLIIYGKVIGNSEPFLIKPTNGGDPVYHTDYYIEPINLYRGVISVDISLDENESEISSSSYGTIPDDAITVRVMGGSNGDVTTIADSEANLEVGNEYLLFLYQTGTGGGYNTKGDYYYVCGAKQGAFSILESAEIESAEIELSEDEIADTKIQYSEDDRIMSTDSYQLLVDEIAEINERTPVNKNNFADTLLENMEQNLESEFITEEEYEQALDEMYQYAEIIE